MEIIAHRINTLAQLRALPGPLGAEIDLRTWNGRIILQHDPCVEGEDFARWIAEYRHGRLILNVKEDGLEPYILAELERHRITDFFFLDVTMPTLYKSSARGFRKFAGRLSEIEPLEALRAIKDRIEWVWLDCFTRLPLESFANLAELNLKICLVSPELVRGDTKEIAAYQNLLRQHGLKLDAVCTKAPHLWADFSP